MGREAARRGVGGWKAGSSMLLLVVLVVADEKQPEWQAKRHSPCAIHRPAKGDRSLSPLGRNLIIGDDGALVVILKNICDPFACQQ